MSSYFTGSQLALSIAFMIIVGWFLLCFIMKRVTDIRITEYSIATVVDGVRQVKQYKINADSGLIPLHYGTNDFFVTIKDGVLKKHTHSEVAALTPILRGSEEIHFIRVTVKVIGNKILRLTKFRQTNLSKQDVRLIWSHD
jgi:hypothetical protein